MLAAAISDEPEGTAEPEPAVGGVPAAPARERERGEDAADQAADVAADGDARDREREREVDHDQRHRVAAEPAGRLPLEDHHRAEDAEDRAGGADGDALRLDERAGRAREPGDEVEGEEAGAAEVLLDRRAEPPQREHVEADVDEVRVQEHRRDQPPPVAVRDLGAEEPQLRVEAAAGVVDARRPARRRSGRSRR